MFVDLATRYASVVPHELKQVNAQFLVRKLYLEMYMKCLQGYIVALTDMIKLGRL